MREKNRFIVISQRKLWKKRRCVAIKMCLAHYRSLVGKTLIKIHFLRILLNRFNGSWRRKSTDYCHVYTFKLYCLTPLGILFHIPLSRWGMVTPWLAFTWWLSQMTEMEVLELGFPIAPWYQRWPSDRRMAYRVITVIAWYSCVITVTKSNRVT